MICEGSWHRYGPHFKITQVFVNTGQINDHRLAHLSPVQYKQPHQPLDIPAKVVVQHKPNAFLKTMLPYTTEGLSKYQMSLYLKLLHGLPLPSPNTHQGICSCGCSQDALGYHRLDCKKHAGRAFRAGHDVIQDAIARELRRLDVKVVDNDQELRKNYSHLTSKKRWDLAVSAPADTLTVYDNVNRLYRSDFILDVKTVSVVNGHGVWTPAFNVDKGKVTNLGLLQQEEVKNRKHGPFYAPIGFAFLPFVTSCFGSFGPTATRFLFALAHLELIRHDDSRHRQGLDPLVDPSARSQYRALCYRHLTARLGHAVAKATVMRLLALPHLPLHHPPDRYSLAQNRPGPADSLLLSSQFPVLSSSLSSSLS